MRNALHGWAQLQGSSPVMTRQAVEHCNALRIRLVGGGAKSINYSGAQLCCTRASLQQVAYDAGNP
jgi:hypothetical protein